MPLLLFNYLPTDSAIEPINLKIQSLAQQLIDEQPTLNPVLVILLDGGLPFGMRLIAELADREYDFDWATMSASSYGDDFQSGKVCIESKPKVLSGARHVIVLDDVCDTGNTYLNTRKTILELGASSVKLMVLVDKVQDRDPNAEPTYSGSKVPKTAFLIGMGLDFRRGGLTRNMTAIRSVDPDSLPTEQELAVLNQKEMLNQQLRTQLINEKAEQQAVCCSEDTMFSSSARSALSERNEVQLDGVTLTPSE
jgi:hypoxanthine phosphoribosyltransferase